LRATSQSYIQKKYKYTNLACAQRLAIPASPPPRPPSLITIAIKHQQYPGSDEATISDNENIQKIWKQRHMRKCTTI